MAKREQLFRLLDIINVLKKNPLGASYDEVKSYLDRQHQSREDETSEVPFSEKTFKRDRNLIFDLFGIEIRYRRSTNTYRIDENDDLGQANPIFDSLLLVNAYRRTENHAEIMLFEKRQATGLHHLDGLIYAIKNNRTVGFSYHKHWDDSPQLRKVEPYAVKEFKNRWYLLATDVGAETPLMKTFGLDRISDLHIHSRTFTKTVMDLNALFVNSFGIITTYGEAPQRIVLSFDHYQGKFVKTLPLHHSQKILLDTKEELQIELTLCPTYDFYQELLSQAERVNVLEPFSVRQEFAHFLKSSLEKNS